ncbi:DUF5688 family protein [[Clostridium] symbiosum]|uniref:DUF5688 family protein n=1 Tax=Clostridium symbiosum TaxID=1512 RepID=UPI001D090A3F|nr:DUF5688 family protein [[Clostridium] symbiosum]MCB6608820.1 DUF5688 family protein [[Clostridium] symbiosum]MCB6929578.1 DUF5688 family protein [[Clostridium] symbiosum]
MIYETFLTTIHSLVQEKLEGRAEVSLRRVLKNNGLLLDGLSISSPSSAFSPTVYLNSYYNEEEEGLSLPVIAEQILLLYEEENGLPSELAQQLKDFEKIRDRIAYKLINAEDNAVLLSEVPHFRYLDLAVVFYIIVSESDDGQMTALIHNEHLGMWNVTREDLSDFAEKNMATLMPCRITPIEDAILAINEEELPGGAYELSGEETDIFPVNLYVLSNERGINGAACLLYRDVLKNFAEQVGDDLVILPSSIHEVLLAPSKKALSYDELNEMVYYINRSEVPMEDRLSDHIYYYSREQNCIYHPAPVSSSSSGPGGTENPQ